MNDMHRGDKGSILIMTMMFLVVLTIIAMTLLNTIVYNTTNSGVQYNNTQALYLAEAGINKAIYYLRNTAPDGTSNGSWRTTVHPAAAGNTAPASCTAADPCEENLGDGSYTMWVQNAGSNIKITSTGNFNGVNRTVKEEVIAASVSSTNLVAQWDLDEASTGSTPNTITDSSGNNHTGSFVGNTAWAAGKIGNGSISLDGTGDYISVSNDGSFDFNVNDFSFSAWVKFNGTLPWFGPIATVAAAGTYAGWEIARYNNVLSLYNGSTWIYTAHDFTADQWKHVAVTHNGTNYFFYLDGQLVSTIAGSRPTSSSGAALLLGARYDTQYSNMYIDNVRIYSRLLTAEEIQILYGGIVFNRVDDEWQECKVLCS